MRLCFLPFGEKKQCVHTNTLVLGHCPLSFYLERIGCMRRCRSRVGSPRSRCSSPRPPSSQSRSSARRRAKSPPHPLLYGRSSPSRPRTTWPLLAGATPRGRKGGRRKSGRRRTRCGPGRARGQGLKEKKDIKRNYQALDFGLHFEGQIK